MNEMVIWFAGFISGAASAFVALGVYGYLHILRLKNIKKAMLDKVEEAVRHVGEGENADSRMQSIKNRLIRAAELAAQQMDLRSQAEMPSKNALHSKHKNGLVNHIAELEHEKLDILKSVLAEGFDPQMDTLNEHGQRETMTLSEYVTVAQQLLDKHMGGARPEPVSPDGPTKTGRFTVYKGGKDDGTTH